MTQGRLAGQIDKVVVKADADAVRRRKERHAGREVWFADLDGGTSDIDGSMLSPDAHALEKRLKALAATVCEHDPRSREQRRADALGALAAGAERLGCRCGRADCAAGKRPAAHAGGDSSDRRARQYHRPRHGTGIRGERRRADSSRARYRTGQVSEVGAAGPPGRCRLRIRLCALEGVGGFCAVPGFDLPLAGLRPAGRTTATSTTPSLTPKVGPHMHRI